MIHIDKKLAKTIRSLSDSYSIRMRYRVGSAVIEKLSSAGDVIGSAPVTIKLAEVPKSLERLKDKNLLSLKIFSGDYYFFIRPELLHRFAFLMDTFTKKFWGGYIAGIISGIIIEAVGGALGAVLLTYILSFLGR